MRRTSLIASVSVLAAGVTGFFIRKSELDSVLDPLTGLAGRNASVTHVLAVLSVLVVLAAAFFSAIALAKRTAHIEYADVFSPASGTTMALLCTLGALWIAAAVKYAAFMHAEGLFVPAEIILASLSALSGVSLMLFAVLSSRKDNGGACMLFSVVPVLFMCFWLVMMYKQNASNPVLISYCYQILAIIFAALSFYYNAGFIYNKPAPAKMLFSSLCAVYFCGIALADNQRAEIKAVYYIVAAVALIRAALMIKNMKKTDEDEKIA